MKRNHILRLSFQIDTSSKMGMVIWDRWGVLSAKSRGTLIRELLFGMAANYCNYDFSDTDFAASVAKLLCNQMSPYSHVTFPKGIEKAKGMKQDSIKRIDISINTNTDEGELIKKLISTMSSKTLGKVIRILLYGAADAFKRFNFEGISYYDLSRFAMRISGNMCPDTAYRFVENVDTFIPHYPGRKSIYIWHSDLKPTSKPKTTISDKDESQIIDLVLPDVKPLNDIDITIDNTTNSNTVFSGNKIINSDSDTNGNKIAIDLLDQLNTGKITVDEYEKRLTQIFNPLGAEYNFVPNPLAAKFVFENGDIVYTESPDGRHIHAKLLINNNVCKEANLTADNILTDIRDMKINCFFTLFDNDIDKATRFHKEVPLDFIYYELPDIDTGE